MILKKCQQFPEEVNISLQRKHLTDYIRLTISRYERSARLRCRVRKHLFMLRLLSNVLWLSAAHSFHTTCLLRQHLASKSFRLWFFSMNIFWSWYFFSAGIKHCLKVVTMYT